MTTLGHFLSPFRQTVIEPYETAARPLVGYAADYETGLRTGFHAHPRAQLLYAVSGVMRVETTTMSFSVLPTTALFLPAHASHSVTMDGRVVMRELFLRQDTVERTVIKTAIIAVTPLLRELIVAVCAERADWPLKGRGKYLTELVIDEISRATPLPLGLSMPRDPRLLRLTSALRNRPDDPRSVEDLARMAGASPRTLARLFQSETGLSFRQWRQQMRMTEALNALVGGATPLRAATLAGFTTQPAFGAAFLKFFGMTPGQARTMNKSLVGSVNTKISNSVQTYGRK